MSVQNKLSDRSVSSLKPMEKKYKVGDGDRLCILVLPTGTKTWQYIWYDKEMFL